MKSPWIESWALPLLVGAFVAGMLVANIPIPHDWKLGWEMLSALGTFAAAAIALWISLTDTRRRQAEARSKATIAAGRHLSALVAYRKNIYRSCIWAEKARGGWSMDVEMRFSTVSDRLQALVLNIPDSDQYLLAGLENQVGEKLARAQADIAAVVRLMASIVAKPDSERAKVAAQVWDRLTVADWMLKDVINECRAVLVPLRRNVTSFTDHGNDLPDEQI